jgi:hypothetical protein
MMSVYYLVGGLRRWLAGAAPWAPSISKTWLRVGFGLSLGAYLALKLAGVVVGLPSQVDLVLVPAGVCALGLAAGREDPVGEAEAGEGALRPALLAGLVLVAFTSTYLALNTVPMTSSVDESAIVNGAHELATKGSLRVTNPLNDRYHTNIIGSLDVTYRTPTAMYHRVFPGTALSYAPFSVLPGDSGYYFYTAFFGTAAIVALYMAAWKLLGSWGGALVAALMLAVSPAFGHWAVTVFNNVPVLSLEFGALALLLWSTPPRGWQLGLAGAMMALAVFMRITEFIFVPPLLALVWWRCRSWSRCLPFALAAFSCVPLVLVTNAIFFHNPFFFPHVGTGYLSLAPSADTGSSQGLVERYFLYLIGVSGSASNFHPVQKLDNIFFHIRYLGSSTFAFPFLAVSFVGLAWWLAARRRDAWLLGSAVGVSVAATILIYGHQHNNYYGFGLPIARASFVRYSLPIYGLLAIAGGAFFLETARMTRLSGAATRSSFAVVVAAAGVVAGVFLLETGRAARLRGAAALVSLVALLAVVGVVGIARSYDWGVYGFNRLNYSREHDRAAWRAMDGVLQGQSEPPLLLVGNNSMKLVDSSRYPDTINYGILFPDAWNDLLFPVVTQAQHDRHVYLAISTIQGESAQALAAFEERYLTSLVVHSGNWALYRVEPPIFEASP